MNEREVPRSSVHVSLGPVQGFVAQSRRTRDLWGSSFLLSFLSAHAMHGAVYAGGRIMRPLVQDDPLYRWVEGKRDGMAPSIGSIPNQFVVGLDEGEPRAIVEGAERAFRDAWDTVCVAVWDRYVSAAEHLGRDTAAIWERQVRGFWEILWAVDDPEHRGAPLARRKQWRTHRLPDEPGDKCTVMHDLQELSGYVRGHSAEEREAQDAFWDRVRADVGPLDVREDERLSALAFVKRLFPKVSGEAIGWDMEAIHWPSTLHVAAVPWLKRTIAAAPEKAESYARSVRDVAPRGVFSESQSSLVEATSDASREFVRLDAAYYFREFVEDERRCPLAGPADGDLGDERDALLDRLEDLQGSEDEHGRAVGRPDTYYALLLADGDHLGKVVAELGAETVGRALADFTGDVRRVVQEHQGVTVYAGGDDVLAMLPLPEAVGCASALSERYARAFEETGRGRSATLSAAVAFAHVRLPLGAVISEAHRLLTDVAKEANGRDSLAVGILTRGGATCEWVTSWLRSDPEGGTTPAERQLGDLEAWLAREQAPGVSSGLLYRLRDTLGILCGVSSWRPGGWYALPNDVDLTAFIRAELLQSLERRSAGGDAARLEELTAATERLLPRARASAGEAGSAEDPVIGFDALLLARFLSAPTREEG